MSFSVLLFSLFVISIIRFFLSGRGTTQMLQLYLFSSCIQSLMIYPVIAFNVALPEAIQKMSFNAPFENFTGLLYPTFISCLIFIVSNSRYTMKWKSIMFPLVVIAAGLLYSFITPYNVSYTASFICFLIFCQILIVVYVVKTCIPNDILLKAIFDGLTIIIVIEFVISVTYVFLGIDYLQSLFYSTTENTGEIIREGSSYRFAMGTTIQHNRLGGLCAYIAVFFLSCRLFNYKKTRSLYLFVISISVLIMSQSRSAILATLAAIFVEYFMFLYKRERLSLTRLVFFMITFVIALLLLININLVNEMFFNSNVDEMADVRQIHYAMGWIILNQNHFMGCGMNSNTHFMYYTMTLRGYGSWLYMHSIHNIHIVIAVELGVLGFLTWVYYMVSRILRFLYTPIKNMNNPIFWFTFVGMLIILLIHGMADFVQTRYQYLMLLILFGAMYSKNDREKQIKNSIYN